MLAHYILHTLPHNLKGYTIDSLSFLRKLYLIHLADRSIPFTPFKISFMRKSLSQNEDSTLISDSYQEAGLATGHQAHCPSLEFGTSGRHVTCLKYLCSLTLREKQPPGTVLQIKSLDYMFLHCKICSMVCHKTKTQKNVKKSII